MEKRQTRARGGGLVGEHEQDVKRGVEIKKVLTMMCVLMEPLIAMKEMWKCDVVKNAVES